MRERPRGSVEILCREIEFPFIPAMETPRLVVAFTRRLVLEIADMRHQDDAIAHLTGKPPSAGSATLMDQVLDMLNGEDIPAMVARCEALHSLAHELNPEEAYPTDHLIDMFSSCISAIRFGCETGRDFGSRHAASAAQHVWTQRYGVRLFDGHTQRWEKDWARCMLQEALAMMAFPAQAGEARRAETALAGSVHEHAVPLGGMRSEETTI